MAHPSKNREVAIIGGGIIGCTTAYYISHHPSFSSQTKVTLIEASIHGLAHGASGKAGGLVAKWAYPGELASLSFTEHVKLAEEHNGAERWGWRYANCGKWEGKGDSTPEERRFTKANSRSLHAALGPDSGAGDHRGTMKRNKGLPDDLSWVKEELTEAYSSMAGVGETAQVHPYLFTTSMFELAKTKGVALLKGQATSIVQANGRVSGVNYVGGDPQETGHIAATHVVLAAGAWSSSLLPALPISGTRAHSITIKTKPTATIAPYVLFTEISLQSSSGSERTFDPEIYARPDNEVYACGPGDKSPLPDSVDDVVVDSTACDSIYTQVSSISQQLRDGTVERHQACFLPQVNTGEGPIIGEAGSIAKGLIVATGHTCWGICNAPGTARAISELVMNGKVRCVSIRHLRPSAFL